MLCIIVFQVDPDPEFPTVKYPNPEEGKGALVTVILTYLSIHVNVILHDGSLCSSHLA